MEFASRNHNEESVFEHKYSEDCERMLSQFIESLDGSLDGTKSLKVLHHTDEPFISICQDPNVSYGYRIVAHLNCSPELAFEYMLNVDIWKQWDDICDCAEIIETVDPVSRFQYIKTKPIWPISARDILLFTTMKKLDDGRYIMVGKSMDHDQCPSRKGVLRMDINFLGMCVVAEPDDDTKCKMTFVTDGDPKGWVPRNIMKFVATNAIPMSLRILSRSLGSLSPIEYNLVPILNSLAELKALSPSSLLSSLRSSILRLSIKSSTSKSRASIISSFILNNKGETYQGSLSSRSVSSAVSKLSSLTRVSSPPESPTQAVSAEIEDNLPSNIASYALEPPSVLPFSGSHSSATCTLSLADSCSLAVKSKSSNPSDSDMTTTLAPSTISMDTKIDSNSKRRRSLLIQPKQVTEKIYGKLRRIKTQVQNAIGVLASNSKVAQQEFNEKMHDPTLTRYHKSPSPGLKVACLA